MNEQSYVNLRVKFTKTGSLQYISHLDLVRTMNKILVRAGLPLWYSGGFNPKPKMVFAAPLSIGTESMTEFMDIRLTHRVPCESVKASLNKNMTEEMQVVDAYYPDNKLTDLKWLSYTMEIKTANSSEELARSCREVLLGESVTVEKKSKDKKDEPVFMDVRPLIKDVKTEYHDGLIRINTVLSADASSFLNPEYVIKALRRYLGVLCDPCLVNEYYTIMRNGAYNADMTDFN